MELLYIVKGSVVKLNLPQVVRVIDTSHQAFLVEHPRLCWTFLKKKEKSQTIKKTNNYEMGQFEISRASNQITNKDSRAWFIFPT
jgi:hypothetical protein